MLSTGQPLGEHGLNWLKIHCVNLTGHLKRASNRERLAYAEKRLEDIRRSAKDPLGGSINKPMFWMTADEPWQTLATCMDIDAALK